MPQFPDLHHRGHIFLAPAACSNTSSCSCSPSSNSESWPHPHHNDRRLTVCPDLVKLPPGLGVQGRWGDTVALGGIGSQTVIIRRPACMRRHACIVLDLFFNLHREVGPGSTPPPSWAHSSRACCLPAFSIKQLCNSATPTPQCRHLMSCLCASSSTFNLHRQVCPSSTPPSSWCNVGAGLGTERTSASECPPSHAVVDILFLSGFCRHSYCLAQHHCSDGLF